MTEAVSRRDHPPQCIVSLSCVVSLGIGFDESFSDRDVGELGHMISSVGHFYQAVAVVVFRGSGEIVGIGDGRLVAIGVVGVDWLPSSMDR